MNLLNTSLSTLLLALAAAALPAAAADSSQKKTTGTAAARPEAKQPESPHRKMCNQRHYSSSALCSDSTCKMREYRKWQACLKTGNYV